MKKKYVLLLVLTLVVVLALFAFTACNNNKTEVGTDLLAKLNGDFETSDSDNTIADWHSSLASGSIALKEPSAGEKNLEGFDFGTQYLVLKSTGSVNYIYQTIEVDKPSVGWMKASKLSPRRNAPDSVGHIMLNAPRAQFSAENAEASNMKRSLRITT